MAGKYVIPFDNNPVNVATGYSGTYTVPSGKYARVTISINASVAFVGYSVGTYGILTASTGGASSSCGCVSTSFDVWLNAGDTVTASLQPSPPNTTIASTTSASDVHSYLCAGTSYTYVAVVINGAAHCTHYARASVCANDLTHKSSSGGTPGTILATFSGTAEWGYCAQEYVVVS